MDNVPGNIAADARLERIEAALASLEQRVRALESGAPVAPAPAQQARIAEPGVVSESVTPGPERLDVAAGLSLVGRTFVVFGGAYLLRALTDSGRLPRGAGIALGVAYALAWLVVADRAAARGRRVSAAFHGTTAVLIGLPLLWDAPTRFALLLPNAAAGAVTAFVGLALFVSWRRALQSLAAAATLGALGVTVGLVGSTGHVAPFAVFAVLVGIATLWLGYDRDWFWLRWPAAIVANIIVLGLVSRAVAPEHRESWHAGIAVPLFLFVAYLASFAARTLVRGRLVIPFEIAQTVAALGIGLGGAVAVAHLRGGGAAALGAAAILLGVGCYAVAFAFVERRHGLGANFFFYSTLALVLTLVGTGILLPAAAFSMVSAALAVLTTWLAVRRSRLALAGHAAVYVCVAALVSGLLPWAATAFGRTLVGAPLALAGWVALAGSVVCLAMPRPIQPGVPATFASVPRLVIALVVVAGAGAVVVAALARVTAGMPADPGIVATDRTAVMALAALALAWATRYERFLELGWLLYPVLLVGAVKLLVEDFPRSKPATLFLALALYGLALIAAPRLARRPSVTAPVDRSPATR